MKRILDSILGWLEGILNMPDAFELEDDENDILEQ
jgi:hypothetical protein